MSSKPMSEHLNTYVKAVAAHEAHTTDTVISAMPARPDVTSEHRPSTTAGQAFPLPDWEGGSRDANPRQPDN